MFILGCMNSVMSWYVNDTFLVIPCADPEGGDRGSGPP